MEQSICFTTQARQAGHISNCRRLIETPTGAAHRGRCLHQPQSACTFYGSHVPMLLYGKVK